MRNEIWKHVVDNIIKNEHFVINIFVVEYVLPVELVYGSLD